MEGALRRVQQAKRALPVCRAVPWLWVDVSADRSVGHRSTSSRCISAKSDAVRVVGSRSLPSHITADCNGRISALLWKGRGTVIGLGPIRGFLQMEQQSGFHRFPLRVSSSPCAVPGGTLPSPKSGISRGHFGPRRKGEGEEITLCGWFHLRKWSVGARPLRCIAWHYSICV